MPKCEVCNLDYYQECECIACPCCDEQTKYEDFIKGVPAVAELVGQMKKALETSDTPERTVSGVPVRESDRSIPWM